MNGETFIKLSDIEDCVKKLYRCPICNSIQVSSHKWPQPSLHGFTIPFICGTELDCDMYSDSATYGKKCKDIKNDS
jgi:transcription elongation factor Elf1